MFEKLRLRLIRWEQFSVEINNNLVYCTLPRKRLKRYLDAIGSDLSSFKKFDSQKMKMHVYKELRRYDDFHIMQIERR